MRSTLRNFCQLGLAPARSSLVFFSPCPAQAQKKKKTEASNPYLSLSLHNLCKLGLTRARSSDLKKRKVQTTLRNFCKLGLTPARSSDPKKKKGRRQRQRQRQDKGKETETEKRQRRDREETEKRQRRDREETEKRQRRDREETEKRQRRDREETDRCGRPSTISLSSALHVFQVTTQKKRKVRSTLHNFCQLVLAPARSSLFFFRLALRKHRKKNEKKKNEKKMNLHRSRVPAYTHNLMTAFDISVELRHLSQKNWTDFGACFDYTHISQT